MSNFLSGFGSDLNNEDLWFDREGNPITLLEWSRLKFEEPGYMRVASTYLLNPAAERAWLSTVWLGISVYKDKHDLFETMLFLPPSSEDHGRWQYSTQEEASAAHEVLLAGLLADGYLIDDDQTDTQLDHKHNTSNPVPHEEDE